MSPCGTLFEMSATLYKDVMFRRDNGMSGHEECS